MSVIQGFWAVLYRSCRAIGEIWVRTQQTLVETNFFPEIPEPAEPNFAYLFPWDIHLWDPPPPLTTPSPVAGVMETAVCAMVHHFHNSCRSECVMETRPLLRHDGLGGGPICPFIKEAVSDRTH